MIEKVKQFRVLTLAAGCGVIVLSAFLCGCQSEKNNVAGAYCNKGFEHYYVMEYEDSIAAYKKAIAINIDDAHAYSGLGNCYFELGQYAKAIAYYKKSIAIAPSIPDPYFNMGSCYLNLKKSRETIAAYKRVLTLEPTGLWADIARETINELSTTQPADK